MDIDEKLNSLIRPRKICLCKNIGEVDIYQAYEKGARTLKAIIKETDASTGCGTCLDLLVTVMQKIKTKELKNIDSFLFK